MKILHINNTDILGHRFNGFDLSKKLKKHGVESEMCVWQKYSEDKNVWKIVNFKGRGFINKSITKIEKLFSLQSTLYPWWMRLPFERRFKDADIIHYHLIHNEFFSIFALPFLTRLKPSVWTLHDPWAMTGHCIYPFNCKKWKSGCKKCLSLIINKPLQKDNAGFNWRIKRYVYENSNIDIIVASKWMMSIAKNSPLVKKFNLHYIPFGLNLDIFRPTDSVKAKKELGVFPGSIVITFRSTTNEYKGLKYIKKVLKNLKSTKKICLITFESRGLLDEFRGKYQIIDLGWVTDDTTTITAYNATDIFLMPSLAEAFGMMAIEAMACGKPVIVFEGTSLPEVVFAPEGGVAVPYGDSNALRKSIERLINNPEERKKIGARALKLVKDNYDEKLYLNRMINLYKEILKNKNEKS